MSANSIRLRGLRAGNLKNWNCELARGAWTAIYGASGAGKSALLFGILEPTSRRRFQILQDPQSLPGKEEDWLQPLADAVEGLDPVIASAGEIPRRRKKQTLATVLDLLPWLEAAWKLGGQYRCLGCQHVWRPLQVEDLLQQSQAWLRREVVLVLGAVEGETQAMVEAGWTRYLVDGQLLRLEEAPARFPENSWLLLDRFRWQPEQESRLADALALALGREQSLRLMVGQRDQEFSAAGCCPQCGQLHQSHWQQDWHRQLDWQDRVLAGKSWRTWLHSPLETWLQLDAGGRHPRARKRLQLLQETGLGHLAAARSLGTLSLGEARRLELVSWMAQVRRGQTVILDEPGMGLHGKERSHIAELLHQLVDQGNTVLTADPAREFLESAHHWLKLGPGGGAEGGRLVGQGTRADLEEESWQADAVSAHGETPTLEFQNLRERFLDISHCTVPLQQVVVFCGVSGSGKTTLLEQELLPRLRREEGVQGPIPSGGVHSLLQRSLRWSAMSTVATLAGVWQEIRAAFAASEEARMRGLGAGDLVAQKGRGACLPCGGRGQDEHHLPCAECSGLGLRPDLLDLRLRSRSLASWLSTPLKQLEKRLPARGRLAKTVKHLIALGLGNRCLGERGRILSLGERGRIALARVLSMANPASPKLFLLDEPCLGLPVQEARKVMQLLRNLCAEGHSFWVVEHHEYFLRSADWMLELGPGAGRLGGQLVFAGTPHAVEEGSTATGIWLRQRRQKTKLPPPPPKPAVASSRCVDADNPGRGRALLQAALGRELAMRSPLLNDLLGAEEDIESKEEEAWMPSAWPTLPKRGVSLSQVLGLEPIFRNYWQRYGKQVCPSCGGEGPWSSFEQAAAACGGEEVVLTTPLAAQILQKTEHPAWLLAAGFRRFVRAGQLIRWGAEGPTRLREGDLVWLDRWSPEDPVGVGAWRDVAHHAQLLGQGVVQAWDVSLQNLLWQYQPDTCRQCGKKSLGYEQRLGPMSTIMREQASLEEVCQLCLQHQPQKQLQNACALLAGSGLLAKPTGHRFAALTELEQRYARWVGWVLHPLPEVVLLADQPLAGLPQALALRLGKAMLDGPGVFHFTDAEAWLEEKPNAIESFPVQPKEASLALALDSWCVPQRAAMEANLREALGLKEGLASYYQRSEQARLRGWKIEEFFPEKSSFACPHCRGRGRHWPHPELALDCQFCHGSGWTGALSLLEEEGLRWMDLGQQRLGQLRQAFAEYPPLGTVFAWAEKLGLGEFLLDAPLTQLPFGVRMLAPLAQELALHERGEGRRVEFRLAFALAGWNRLEAAPISSRIAGFPSAHLGLEWREHHPLFASR